MNYELKHAVKDFKSLRLSIVFKMLAFNLYAFASNMIKGSNIFMI